MIKLNKSKIVFIALIIISILSLSTTVNATGDNFTIDPDKYDPGQQTLGPVFLGRASTILGIIKYIGILISVLGLAIIGIKFLLSSVEGKAEYKKALVPYLVGCVMIGGITLILEFIERVASI